MTERKINEMPDKETLEGFVSGLSGEVKVVYNIEKGKLEWTKPRPTPTTDSNLGQPKTPEGRRISKL
jgi:hypothetical protein